MNRFEPWSFGFFAASELPDLKFVCSVFLEPVNEQICKLVVSFYVASE